MSRSTRDRRDDDEVGIVFGEEFPIIKRISGPVSMSLMTHASPFFPTVLLFGDTHRSKANSCSPCQCETESTSSCCSELHNMKNFLKPLDTLAATHGPVDFYLETFPAGTFSSSAPDYLTDLKQTVAPCMVLKPGSSQCELQNIRWQGGDIRNSNINSSIFKVSELTARIHGLQPNTGEFQFKSTFSNMTNCRIIEGALDQFYALCKNINKEKNVTFLELLYSPYWNQDVSDDDDDDDDDEILLPLKIPPVAEHIFSSMPCPREKVFTIIQFVQTFIKTVFDEKTTRPSSPVPGEEIPDVKNKSGLNIEAGVNFVFDELQRLHNLPNNTWRSSICRQIYKQRFQELKNSSFWKDHVTTSMTKYIADWRKLPQKPIEDMVQDWWVNNYAYSILFQLNTLLTDVYTVSRMLKAPTNGEPCKLALAFFGNSHTLRMQTLLSKIDYDTRASIAATHTDQKEAELTQTQVRCLSINERIDIKELLLSKGSQRKRTFNHFCATQALKTKENSEKKGRFDEGSS